MHGRLRSWFEKRGLKLNEKKTGIVDLEKESFEFLGFRLAWRKHGKSQAHYGDAYCNERLHDHYGLVIFPMHTKWQNS
jgi:hypothetical protein